MQLMSELQDWQSAITGKGTVLVLQSTTSTQDAAIEHNLKAGDICCVLSQTDGRGRRGNKWIATGGVALTVVLKESSPVLPIAVAAVLAAQLNTLIPSHQIGIKWPNDLLVSGCKLAGVLIEQREERWLVGVGVNVLQHPKLEDDHATDLVTLGYCGDRAAVAQVVSQSIFEAVELDESSAISAWRSRDVIIGTKQQVISGGKQYEGMVIEIDPCQNVILDTETGIVTLPAAISTIVHSN